MPGLFSQISGALSGGDGKLVDRIEEFVRGYLIQGEVGRTLGLTREENALLAALLAEELYRAYCADQARREPQPKAIARLEEIRGVREAAISRKGEALERLEAALKTVAGDLATLAGKRGKLATGFASVDGLTESLVAEAIGAHASQVKAARRAPPR